MEIITYRMNDKEDLEFSDRNLLIRLNKGQRTPIFERAIFFTPDFFPLSVEAKENLSLSYSPRFALVFNYLSRHCNGRLYTNDGAPIPEPEYANGNIPMCKVRFNNSKVWPAFGHLGGASELVLSDGTKASGQCENSVNRNSPLGCEPILRQKMREPYIDDVFHQDDTTDYTLPSILKILSSRIIQAISEPENFTFPENAEDQESPGIGTINISNGVSIRFLARSAQILYSLSIGIKCDLMSKSIVLMFWGYGWQDWDLYRFYDGPITYSYTWRPNFDIDHPSEENLKELFRNDLCREPSDELYKIVSSIRVVLDNLRQINDTSLRISHRAYLLPFVPYFMRYYHLFPLHYH